MTADDRARGARIFRVETRFQRLAQRPGLVRELAMVQAETNVQHLKLDFDSWLRGAVAELAAALADLDRDPADPEAALRAENGCRDLQAVAGSLGFDIISMVANSFGDLLSAIRDGARYDAAAIGCHADALSLAIRAGPALPLDQVAEFVDGLRKVAEKARISARAGRRS